MAHIADASTTGPSAVGDWKRQELLAAYKPWLEAHYVTFHGMADLYVYFYELGVRVLRPGGLLSFIEADRTETQWAHSILQLLIAQNGSTTRLLESLAGEALTVHVLEQAVRGQLPRHLVRFDQPAALAVPGGPFGCVHQQFPVEITLQRSALPDFTLAPGH